MPKKIKDANGNTYVQKKPFYKRFWFWILIVIVVGAVATNMNKSDKKTTSSDAKTESKKSASKSNSNKVNLKNFDTITLSETDGSTPGQVKQLFGKVANSTSETTVEGLKSKTYTWSNVLDGSLGSNVVIGFSNNHAIVKSISGLKIDRKKKISLSDFDSVQNNQTKNDVLSKFGKPNGYSITKIADQTSEMWEYTSGIKGDLGANFNVTFTNDAVSGKSQASMK